MKVFLVLMFVSGAVLADDGALLRCRSQADGAGRLACYDAIPVVAASAAVAAALPAAPVAYVPPVPTHAELERMFGMEPAALQGQRLESISSRIDGPFEGWVPEQRIRLANGQVWKVVDGSDDVLSASNPAVTVKRGLLGAIFLDIEGAHRAPKVRRVQ